MVRTPARNICAALFLALVVTARPGILAAQENNPTTAAAQNPNDQDLLTGAENLIRDIEASATAPAAKTETETEKTAAPEALTLDLQQCVARAIDNNSSILSQGAEVKAAKARIGQARSRMFPEGKTSMTFTDNNLNMGGGLIGSVGMFNVEGITRTDQVSLSQILFAGGQIRAGIKASKFLAESQEWQQEAAVRSLEFETQRAFYDCLLAQNLVKVASSSVTAFERHLRDAQNMHKAGVVSSFEELRAKTELNARQDSLVMARNQERAAFITLRRIIVLSQDAPLSINGSVQFIPIPADVTELVARAEENRPELLALQKAIGAAQQDIKRTTGQYWPTAAAVAQWSNTDKGGISRPDGYTVSLNLGWEFSTGNKRHYELTESKARLDSLEFQIENVRLLVDEEVRQYYLQVEDTVSRVQREKSTVELARESSRIAQVRFKEGVATQADVMDAELAVINAETTLAKAIHDYAVAHAALRRACGQRFAPTP